MDDLKTIVARIEGRLAELGLNPSAASKAAGLSPGAIRNLQRGARGEIKLKGASAKTLGAIATALKVDLNWLMGGATIHAPALSVKATTAPPVIRPEGPEKSTVEPAPNAPTFSQFGDFDIEVRGITVGGEDDEFYFNGKVSEHVRRPPGLMHKKGVFAVEVSNDSMVPRYDPGDLIYVQKANPVADDDVVVELYHPEDENLAGKSFVKTFVRRTGRRITCKQFNPPKEVEFDAGEVREIYKVFRNRDLFG